jgi:5-enolpyruvylshikimate-3-phosphate synthase
MGCRVEESAGGITVYAPTRLRGLDVDLSDIPDTAQTLAVIAPFASSPTTIRGIASARVKESDRVAATCTELARLGVTVDEHPDGMTIYPCQEFRPAAICTYNDHRMAMAFALTGLRLPGISIENQTAWQRFSRILPGAGGAAIQPVSTDKPTFKQIGPDRSPVGKSSRRPFTSSPAPAA